MPNALRQRGDADDIKKLRREFGHLQSLLAERDMEIAQLRLDSEHARERWTADARMSLEKAEHQWKAEAEAIEREERRSLGFRRTMRDVFLVASISVVAVMLYLHFDLAALVNLFPPLASIIDTTPRAAAPVTPASGQAGVAGVAARGGPSPGQCPRHTVEDGRCRRHASARQRGGGARASRQLDAREDYRCEQERAGLGLCDVSERQARPRRKSTISRAHSRPRYWA